MIRIDESSLKPLVLSIEYLKNIFTDELVISINEHDYWIFAAVMSKGIIKVANSAFPFRIINVYVKIFADIIELEISLIHLIGVVERKIISEDYKVVGVVLCEEGVEIVLDSIVRLIVKAID